MARLIPAAVLLGPVAILFVVLGFATDHWVDVDVNRSKLSIMVRTASVFDPAYGRFHYTRHSGIIRECYPGTEAKPFLEHVPNAVGGCIFLDFDDPKGEDNMSDEYQRRMHLVRSIMAMYVLGMVGILVAFAVGLGLCAVKKLLLAQICTTFSLAGAGFLLLSMILFHAKEYVENNNEGHQGELVFHNVWSKDLLLATESDFGYSYALAWVGLILAIVDGILYLVASRSLKNFDLDDDDSSSEDYSSYDGEEAIIKKMPSITSSDYHEYDNKGMKHEYPALPWPTPVFMQAMPTQQALPAYPQLAYANSYYLPSDSERN